VRAQKRALETVGETLERNEKDRACKANKRASESHDETVQRKKHNKTSMAKKRASTIVTLNSAIASFQSKIKLALSLCVLPVIV
jgi:hypothetical protein